MTKPIIAVDVDEVLIPQLEDFLAYYNAQNSTDYKVEDLVGYYIEDVTGETEEQMMEHLKAFIKTKVYSSRQPLAGAIKAISKLREQYDLVVITARYHFFRGSTETFLKTHFSDVFKELHYTHLEHAPDEKIPKYKICQQVQAIALIDDSLSNVSECAEHGMQGVLFGNYPWNQVGELPANVVRCEDWPAVEAYFAGRG